MGGDAFKVRTLVGLARSHAGGAQAVELDAQVGRRFDVVTRIVGRGVEDDERGGAGDQAETFAEPLDFGAIEVVVHFERGHPHACPALRGQPAAGLAGVPDRHDDAPDRRGGAVDAQHHLPLGFGQPPGQHDAAVFGER